MGQQIQTIITQEQAEYVQRTSAHMVTLYKHIDGQPHRLALGRAGAGLDGIVSGWTGWTWSTARP